MLKLRSPSRIKQSKTIIGLPLERLKFSKSDIFRFWRWGRKYEELIQRTPLISLKPWDEWLRCLFEHIKVDLASRFSQQPLVPTCSSVWLVYPFIQNSPAKDLGGGFSLYNSVILVPCPLSPFFKPFALLATCCTWFPSLPLSQLCLFYFIFSFNNDVPSTSQSWILSQTIFLIREAFLFYRWGIWDQRVWWSYTRLHMKLLEEASAWSVFLMRLSSYVLKKAFRIRATQFERPARSVILGEVIWSELSFGTTIFLLESSYRRWKRFLVSWLSWEGWW